MTGHGRFAGQIAVCCALALLASSAPAREGGRDASGNEHPVVSDWSQWMGPLRNGTSPEAGLLRAWPAAGPKLLWQIPVDRGWGTPTIAGGGVFFAEGGGTTRTVRCVDALTGAPRWQTDYTFDTCVNVGWGWCERSTVTVCGKRLFSLDEQGHLLSLDAADGRIIWQRDLDKEFAPGHHDWKGWCWSPLVADGILVAPIGPPKTNQQEQPGTYIGIDAGTGSNVWEYVEPAGKCWKGGASLFQTPQLTTIGNTDCILATVNGRLVAIGLRDGKRLAAAEDAHFADVYLTPQRVNGHVLVTPAINDPARLFSLRDGKLAPIWQSSDIRASYATWLCHGDYLFGFHNATDKAKFGTGPYALRCVRVADGKMVWEQAEGFEKPGVSLLLADGLLFIRNETALILAEASSAGYAENGRLKIGSDANYGWVMPTLSNGRLYVRGSNQLRCYQVAETLPDAAVINGAETTSCAAQDDRW